MAKRPDTRESRPTSSPAGDNESGVATIAASEANRSPSVLAEEVADDITFSMFDNVLNTEAPTI